MNVDLKKAKELFKGGMAQKIIIAAGLIGLGLILLSEFWPSSPAKQTAADTSSSDTADAYVTALEQKLTDAVSRIEGVGACSVMVTLENGVQYVYANQQKISGNSVEDSGSSKISSSSSNEDSVVVVNSGSGQGSQGLLVTEIQPTVNGVVVVCSGGGDADVQKRVTDAVTTVLGITSRKVCVVQGN